MKLFSLNYSLSMKDKDSEYLEKCTLNIPAASDSDAREKFLTSINDSQFFISSFGTYWPVLYTRVIITSSTEHKPAQESKSELTLEVSPKKERKPRAAKKVAKKQIGIKASSRGRSKGK